MTKAEWAKWLEEEKQYREQHARMHGPGTVMGDERHRVGSDFCVTHVDLFSGIGGFALAAQWAGFQTVAFVEIEPYAQEIIKARFGAVADAERFSSEQRRGCGDMVGSSREAQGEGLQRQWCGDAAFDSRPSLYGDIRDFPARKYRGATLLTGGFPCQPFSQAGKRRGTKDNRYLWNEMFRVIRECQPAWILAENVDGLTSMVEFDSVLEVDDREYTPEEMASGSFAVGEVRERVGRGILHAILEDLKSAGYTVQTFVIPACAVDAKHRRDRVWIVAHNASERQEHSGEVYERGELTGGNIADSGGGILANARNGAVNQRSWNTWRESGEWASERTIIGNYCRWLPEPDVGRVAHGIPARVDRLKGLGNSIVPQVAYQILKGIAG